MLRGVAGTARPLPGRRRPPAPRRSWWSAPLGDPATPYEQTPASWPACSAPAAVLTWQGEGHTAYPQTRASPSAVNRYLVDLGAARRRRRPARRS